MPEEMPNVTMHTYNGTDCTGCDKRLVLTEEDQAYLIETRTLLSSYLPLAEKPEDTKDPVNCPECWALYISNHDHFCVVHRGTK